MALQLKLKHREGFTIGEDIIIYVNKHKGHTIFEITAPLDKKIKRMKSTKEEK